MFYFYLLILCLIVSYLQVAGMSKSRIELFDITMIGPLLFAANQYLNCIISEYFALWIFNVSI